MNTAVQTDGAPAMSIRLPAEPESLSIVRQAVTGIAEVIGIDDQDRDDLRVAVSEACTNVVLHAYPGEPGGMHVQAWHTDHRLVVSVRDTGQGIIPNPDSTSPGLGIGLQLMATLSEDVRLSTPPGGGTEVVLTFVRRER